MGFSSKLVAGDSLDLSQNGGLEIPKPERQKTVTLRCPRCESTNTKFCYYNNYSKSQPRHFCRACRRYWTDGGTLRNVPVGGGRKNKRLKTAHNTSTSMDDNGIAQHQRQQQQMPLPPFDGGDGRSSIFPGILRQVLLRPPLPLAYSIDGSGLFPLPPIFLPEFSTVEADLWSPSDNVINTLSSISSSPCSPPYNGTRLDPVAGEDGLAAWKAPTPSPASYLTCWDDMSGLVNAQGAA
ncbi:uncharacterized protein LOC103699907 [Phoenix dactylifera]|uniref:Dof zinc finger protein n=1 Tax=Phoenix dactylifera TaxID=42345 RepID=A0A8B7BKU8_PHODC|nr:uncharacterized protein LOC103699907 [Phoenix dactylifera]